MSGPIWTPQPKQALLMSRPEPEALYGGAAGGGKSDALVIEALRQVSVPWYRGLILRRTYPQLRELIDKTLQYYPAAYPGARYNSSSHTWTFPSGAKIIFGSLPHEDSKYAYQGLQLPFIAFDELTHFTSSQYDYLRSRNRPSGPGLRVYMRASANPGSVGHAWVKARFITPAPPMTPIWEDVAWVEPDGRRVQRKMARIFVPSTVFDNQALLSHDPDYVARLASLPAAERKALLYGDWDSFAGQVFSEWRDDPAGYQTRHWTHVINPFRVPPDWPIWCGMDWGYARPFAVGWYAVDHDGRLYRIREYYGCDGTPNVGIKLDAASVARKIKEIEADDVNLRGRRITRTGDPAIWGAQGPESIGDLMAREGVYWDKGDHARISGKMQLHHRLRFDADGIPMLYVFRGCKHFIRTVPALVYSERDPEDVDTDGEDHIYDECRYVCMANPISPPVEPLREIPEDDPLNLYHDPAQGQHMDPYAFYRIS